MSEHTARICENSHVLSISLTDTPNVGNYCEICGAKGIDCCQDCRTLIPGITTFWASTFRRPRFCRNCSKPYPWAGKTVEVAETPQAK